MDGSGRLFRTRVLLKAELKKWSNSQVEIPICEFRFYVGVSFNSFIVFIDERRVQDLPCNGFSVGMGWDEETGNVRTEFGVTM